MNRPSVRARAAAFTLVLIALVAGPAPAQSAPAHADEYRLKAAILYNLAKFVDWPADAFADAASPLSLCVIGADPFGPLLDDTLRGHLVAGRPVVARRIADLTSGCQVLFIAGSEKKRLPVLLDRLRGQSLLTVSEDDAFVDLGGMIGLITEGERVRFNVNADAAERARLKVSARLLALASSVKKAGQAR